MTVLGFTGTRDGMTPAQKQSAHFAVSVILGDLDLVRHGDCLGADVDFDVIARCLAVPVLVHPPTDSKLRAFCGKERENLEPKPYLERNRDIVDLSDLLLATPKEDAEPPVRRGGGTWATVRYARRRGTPVLIIWPDGHQADG